MSIFKKSEHPLPKMAPLGRCEFEISGESFKTENLSKLFVKYKVTQEGYHTLDAILRADPDNEYDKNAVEVLIDNLSVGYIPKEKAKKISAVLQNETKNGKAEVWALIKYAKYGLEFSTVRLDLDWPPKLWVV
jgi:hypothetical protein